MINRTTSSNKEIRARMDAVYAIEDQSVLARIAVEGDVYERLIAVQLLTDQTDQALFVRIVSTDKDSFVRLAVVEKISDLGVLEKIARTDENVAVRCAALERLEDNKVLAYIARLDKDWRVRTAAVRRITDIEMLKRIGETEDLEVRCAVLERIKRLESE